MYSNSFDSKLWLYPGEGAWYFVTLPKDVSAEVKSISGPHNRRFGSLRVEVTIGKSTWTTSLFPDNKVHSYLLPIKKEIRKQNGLVAGSSAQISFKLLEL